MTLAELRTKRVGDTVTVLGVTHNEVETKIVSIDRNRVTLDTTGTELDARRSQIDIDLGFHIIVVFARFLA